MVYAIRPGDAPFVAPNADLTYSSAASGTATVTAHGGLVTGVAAGSTQISVYITANSSVDAECTVVVPS